MKADKNVPSTRHCRQIELSAKLRAATKGTLVISLSLSRPRIPAVPTVTGCATLPLKDRGSSHLDENNNYSAESNSAASTINKLQSWATLTRIQIFPFGNYHISPLIQALAHLLVSVAVFVGPLSVCSDTKRAGKAGEWSQRPGGYASCQSPCSDTVTLSSLLARSIKQNGPNSGC